MTIVFAIDEEKTNSQSQASALFVGLESVGKSQLIAGLTGQSGSEANFRGSTVHIQRYRWNDLELIDTPGIHRKSDSETTKMSLAAISRHDSVVLVVSATHLDEQLAEMLPMVAGKSGMVIVTFWDKVQIGEAAIEAIAKLSAATNVEFITLNGRLLTHEKTIAVQSALNRLKTTPAFFSSKPLSVRAGWRIEPKPGVLSHPWLGPMISIGLLLLPTLLTIFAANTMAGWLHPIVAGAFEPWMRMADALLPSWLSTLLTAKIDDFGYGLLNMGPFLLVWALPTVLLFSLILGIYKTTGLIEYINVALHPYSKYIGLSGRDLVRLMMGFGCNVPAVVSTRACSGCSRGTAISAIAFGAACSYQLPATLAVLAAASTQLELNVWLLPIAFQGYLLITTLLYLRWTSPHEARSSLNLLIQPSRPFLQWPTLEALWREAWGTLKQFLTTAIPIFVMICIVASILATSGLLQSIAVQAEPIMWFFNLPGQAAMPVILASIRKDGIFLFAAGDRLAMSLSAMQTLTAVYLSGVFLPCIVTAFTIARETTVQKTLGLLGQQAGFAIAFSWILALIGKCCST